MTQLLREAMTRPGAPSLYAIAKETGTQKASLGRFVRGEQSLRLDLADRIAEFLEIESRFKADWKDNS
ncbi:MAG: helix-turn-helix domain-containing protein [Phycisphaeraceae bacterium JB051]